MVAIETTDLTRRFGEVTALSGLTLSVDEGALFGLLGPNGSGKTTTIELLTGQREPSGGSATVVGHDPVTEPMAVKRAIGILPEREDPPSFLTPREYLTFVGEVRDLGSEAQSASEDVSGQRPRTIDDRIETWAERLEFAGVLDALSTGLSEGERQRVMLAAAFLHDPDLVFIDEPLVNLDPIMQEQVKAVLSDYCERGNTLFLSTHYVDVAAELCTHVGIVEDGELVAECDPREMSEDELLEYFIAEVGGERRGSGVAVQP
ncbi:ABC transporter ATP-binding protein [Haloarcula salinisoli]|uniref:ABC transporter ATP-binding protein n=1 Tax=Haloarcula salinisoli TaxID=2487746 RepID=A0A8J7YGJ1_9EURY|nr:ABC transporter ATP-binding protein [Halomicroarcula salinisoli]MBX0302973.1 ABC transporter ATP-binding protein [Halomicroarcula salinisoli]